MPIYDDQWDILPKVIITSNQHCDPKVMDNIILNKENWYNTILDINHGIINSPFNKFGEYKYLEPTSNQYVNVNDLETQYRDIFKINTTMIEDLEFNQEKLTKVNLNISPKIESKKANFKLLHPYFLNTPARIVKKTI